jgi:hypothetical protein
VAQVGRGVLNSVHLVKLRLAYAIGDDSVE